MFVANPNKPADIVAILLRNREKLIQFLSRFRNEIEDDQFNREKAYLIKEIETLDANAAAKTDGEKAAKQ